MQFCKSIFINGSSSSCSYLSQVPLLMKHFLLGTEAEKALCKTPGLVGFVNLLDPKLYEKTISAQRWLCTAKKSELTGTLQQFFNVVKVQQMVGSVGGFKSCKSCELMYWSHKTSLFKTKPCMAPLDSLPSANINNSCYLGDKKLSSLF